MLLNELKYITDNLNENFSQAIKNDLLRIIDFENELINQVPDEFHFIKDFRLSLSLTPKEINNLNLKYLWEKIESLNNMGLLNLDLSHENPKTRLYNHLLLLNLIGYWCDNIDKEKKQVAFNYDCEHGIYGSLCHSIASSDKRFLKRLRAAYYHMSIPTKIFHLSGNVFNELD